MAQVLENLDQFIVTCQERMQQSIEGRGASREIEYRIGSDAWLQGEVRRRCCGDMLRSSADLCALQMNASQLDKMRHIAAAMPPMPYPEYTAGPISYLVVRM